MFPLVSDAAGLPCGDPLDAAILALDLPQRSDVMRLLDSLRAECPSPPRWVKVGLELFLAEGRPFVNELREGGYSVFLDLKLHDIPNTVRAAIRSLGSLQPALLTVHAAGGPAMLHAAAEAAASLPGPPRLLAVTVLTSMDAPQLQAVGVPLSPLDQVLALGSMAVEAGVSGLVASPLEAAHLRAHLHSSLHLVTPGIRPATDAGLDDQQRVATPLAALRAGANQIVIGRPITRAANPPAAWNALLADLSMTRT